MTDWLRTLASHVYGWLVVIGLLFAAWIAWSRRKAKAFQLTDAQLKAVQDSQRYKRPTWDEPHPDPKERPRVP